MGMPGGGYGELKNKILTPKGRFQKARQRDGGPFSKIV